LFITAFEHETKPRIQPPLSEEWIFYMQGGQKTYTWSTIFALRYLRPFILGGPYTTSLGSGSSAYAGIIVSEQIIKDVQQAAETAVLGSGEQLIKLPADKCRVVYRS